MLTLSNHIQSLESSPTVQMAVRARQLEAKGNRVIKFNIGEPDFKTPEKVCVAAKKAIDDGYFFYSPVPGYLSLRQAIVKKLQRDNQLHYDAEQVMVSTGAKHSIANALAAILNPGEEVIVFSPYWVSYPQQVKLYGGVPVFALSNITHQFIPPIEEVKALINSKTKAIIFSSPSNPTGAILDRKYLDSLAKLVEKHDIYVISDEIYEYINFTSNKHVSIADYPAIKEKVILINGFSKSYAMTGWRLGYMVADPLVVKNCIKLQGQVTSGNCSIAQMAAITAAQMHPKELAYMTESFFKRRNLMMSLLSQIEGFKVHTSQGTFYLFPDISELFGKKWKEKEIKNSFDLAMYLLEEAHVAVVDGGGFGSPNNIRISFASSEEDIIYGIQAIEKAVKKLS